MAIENEDNTLAIGQQPIYAFCDGTEIWHRVRCDSTGALIVSASDTDGSETQSYVAEPTTTAQTAHDGPAQLLSVTNTTAGIVSILDGLTLVAMVLPATTLSVPITISTSLNFLSTGPALGNKVAIIWRPKL